jgi:phage baseplate assembly protein W
MIHAPKFPLRFKEKKGFENTTSTKELVKFHLTNLLLTNPGEKISDLNYGVGLRQMLFENMTIGTLNLWQDKITDSINRYIGYINLSDVQIIPFYEQNKINIKIVYNLLRDTEQQVLEIAMNIGDSGTTGPTY